MSKHNQEVQRTSHQAYQLRREGKRWKQIAEITGVRTVYEHGKHIIEVRARRYADRNNLPWPPPKDRVAGLTFSPQKGDTFEGKIP